MHNLKSIVVAIVMVAIIMPVSVAGAKVKILQKADKSYDFKAVKAIVVPVIKSKDVDYGKVDPERLPKIKAILAKVKKNMREGMVKGSKNANTSIPFYYKAPSRRDTTLILEYNIDKFDNGNQAKRLLPFGGKSEVQMTVKFVNAKTKAVVTEVKAKAKAKGGVVAGGTDAEVLWSATNMANADVYKYLKKLTGLEYDFWAGVTKGSKMGIKHATDPMKEEKREVKKK